MEHKGILQNDAENFPMKNEDLLCPSLPSTQMLSKMENEKWDKQFIGFSQTEIYKFSIRFEKQSRQEEIQWHTKNHCCKIEWCTHEPITIMVPND